MARTRGLMLVLLAANTFTLASAGLFGPGEVQLGGNDLVRRATTTPTPTPSPPPFCNTSQISKMDVGSCRCRPRLSGCPSRSCPACLDCPKCTLTASKTTKYCTGGCTDSEVDCEGCGLWFHSVCDCLATPGTCTMSGTIQKNGAPIWMLTDPSSGDPLFTTTELLPGIQEMIKQPAPHNAGWVFAQKHYQPFKQALALNPYRVRDMEQIHIHLCVRNNNTAAQLTKITDTKGDKLVPVVGYPDLRCLVLPDGGLATSFASSIAEFYATADCKDLVGAGIIRDDANRTWACATTDSAGPIGTFCYKKK